MLEELVGNSTAIERAINGEELSFDDGMEILDDDNLHVIGAAADIVRKKLVGDTVSFAASYYMNYTNLCAASCQMCAFYRKGDEDDAYTLSPDQIEKRVAAAKDLGATEVHIVGGFHPDLQLDYYEQMMSAIKSKHPDMTIKAFTAAVLGGIGSVPGAMLGGMLLGLVEGFWAGYFSVEYKDVASFGILVLVLIFLPSGLLGRPEIEKV